MKKIIHLFIVIIMVVAIVAVYYIGEKRLNSGSNLQNTILAEKPKVSTIVSINTPVNKSKVVDGSLEETESRNEIRKRNILFRKNKTTDASGLDQYNDKPIPILMYHSIAYEKGNDARIPIEKFREQMKFLKDNGYNTLTLTELSDLFTKNIPVPKKSVVLTFDDGYVDNYTNALPILKEFGIKATVFVMPKKPRKSPKALTATMLNAL